MRVQDQVTRTTMTGPDAAAPPRGHPVFTTPQTAEDIHRAAALVEFRRCVFTPPRGVDSMLAEDIDFYRIFRIHPTAMALLTSDLEFIDANDEFLEASGHSLDDLIGRNIFAVLPKMPVEPGHPKWTALEAALTSGQRETYKLSRYDIEDPAHPGVFQERYWCSSVTPLHGKNGQIEVLEPSAREITPFIDQFRTIQAERG